MSNVHTLLRLPTGIFYAQGVKANVLLAPALPPGCAQHFALPVSASLRLFERKEASEKPWTKDLWIYDLRTNQHFTLKTSPLANKDLDDFKACYGEKTAGCKPALHTRKETECFRKFTYAEIISRDKANLDILWLKDDSLEDSETLPAPALLAAEIVESLEAALAEFRAVEEALAPKEDQNHER